MTSELYESAETNIKDNSNRAATLIAIFWIIIGLSFLAILSGYYELLLLERIQLDQAISPFEATISEISQGILGVTQTVLVVISAIVFIKWFRRAYANLHKSGLNYLRHSEKMALWSFFIPIVSLFWPYQIMKEIWNETQYQIKKLDPRYTLKNGEWMIGLWWSLFIISNIIGNYILKTTFREETLEQIISGSKALIFSDLLDIPEALLVILIVKKVSNMESKWVSELINKNPDKDESLQVLTAPGS